MFDFHRKCGLSHRKPWNVKWKKEKEKKNKRPNNQRQDLPILRFLIHISHCYRSFKLRHLPAKHIGSSLKLIKRSRNSWLQSTNIIVHIIHPTLDIHHHEFNMTKFTLDWNASYHPSVDNPNPATVNFIWRFFNFSLYFKKVSIIALLLTSALSTLK